jgi:hypothetical protein
LLELARISMTPQKFDDKTQLLRVALSTLMDSAARLSYDAKLNSSERQSPGALQPQRAPAPAVARAPLQTPSQAQADALALRAEALALRADAMMIRAGIHQPEVGAAGAGVAGAAGVVQAVASGSMTALKRVASAIGLLVIVGGGFFVATRLFRSDAPVRRSAMEVKASEQVVLQEYYQTHGVRPASMAELELLQADQRRRDNESRLVSQDRDKQEREARQFEEESRRRADQVAENLRRAEESAKAEAERQRYEDLRKKEIERQQAEVEQRRIDREKAHWQEVLRR